jgi:4-hydroxy-tetrahydrodipicolinate synthase
MSLSRPLTGKPLAGIFPYLVSPVDGSTGAILEKPLRKLVDHLIDQGVQGVSPLGSTGEFAYLDRQQKAEIIRIVVDQVAGRVPVVPGVSSFSTVDALKQAETCAKLGADAIVLMLQAFFPVPPSGVIDYFTTVAQTSSLPICLYANPGLTVDLPPATVNELSFLPSVQYFKEASGNTGRILTTMNLVGDRMQMFSASAHIPLVVFQLGGVGWMAGPACLMPKGCVHLWKLCQAGRWDEALALQRKLWRLNEVFQRYSLAACIKTGLQLQGFEVGDALPPQRPLGADAVADIRGALELTARLDAEL